MSGNNKNRVRTKHLVNSRYMAYEPATMSSPVDFRAYRAFKESRQMFFLIQLVDQSENSALEHARNVMKISGVIGIALGLPAAELHKIRTAAFLHDIGKYRVPASLLSKPGRLTGEEMEIVKNHPLDGAEITSRVAGFQEIAPVIKHHHEKFDGTGYPGRLKGDNIPLFSRIISIADAFDAMVSRRLYADARSSHDALNEIHRCSGTQFDPVLVNVFSSVSGYLN
jgi:putative nucleotidyltransferase with HDIG domain